MSFLDFLPIVVDVIEGAFAQNAADNQQDFQRDMSSTAHQREVADLRAAGLNPVLSANQGASSPSGAQAQTPDFSDSITKGVSSALARQRLEADLEQIRAQTNKTNMETRAVQQGVNMNKPAEDFSSSILAQAVPYLTTAFGLGGSALGAAHGIKSLKNAGKSSAKSKSSSMRWKSTAADNERALGKNGKTKAQNRKDTRYKRKKGSLTEQFHRNFPEW